MKNKGLLIVFSGPSGAGKDSVLNELMKIRDDMCLSVSATTRPMRSGETDGESYFFMSREEFEKKRSQGGFLENAEFCGNYYGTPKEKVYEQLENGKNVILEIEVQGAMQVKENCKEAIFVFVLPPSMEVLKKRLVRRNTESEEVIDKRLKTAKNEIETAVKYDYLIINDALEDAVNQFDAIITAEKSRIQNNIDFLKERF